MTDSPQDPAGSEGRSDASPGAASRAVPTVATVEALVRSQMATALGGRRGMVEAGIPGMLFTILWLTTKELQLALVVSLVAVGGAIAARLVQRGTLQYALNALFAIGIGWLFVQLAASSGGSESDQALAFFLPGILVSLGYTIVMAGSCLVGWPFIGFMLGSVTGDPTAWHDDKQIVRLCNRLTWVFLAPGAVGVLLQGPVWLLGWSGVIDVDLAVLLVGTLRLGLGWPLRIASWSAMVWLLARNATPLGEDAGARAQEA